MGRWSLAQLSKKGKKGKGVRNQAVKRGREAAGDGRG
jgi:hypothetical protein